MLTWIPSIHLPNVSINIPAPWILWDMIYVIPILDSKFAINKMFYTCFTPSFSYFCQLFLGYLEGLVNLGVYLSILEEWGVNQENIIGT